MLQVCVLVLHSVCWLTMWHLVQEFPWFYTQTWHSFLLGSMYPPFSSWKWVDSHTWHQSLSVWSYQRKKQCTCSLWTSFLMSKVLKKMYPQKIKPKFVDFLLPWFILLEFQWSPLHDQVTGAVDLTLRVHSLTCNFALILYAKVIQGQPESISLLGHLEASVCFLIETWHWQLTYSL